MVEKRYQWDQGAVLEEHSKRKHKILREYFFDYLSVRCKLPQQSRFRLAIVDAFAGGGRYGCGAAGSPIIFLEELMRASEAVNLHRSANGFAPLEIECLLILNDESAEAVAALKTHTAPLLTAITELHPRLHAQVHYLNQGFETAYPAIKPLLASGSYRNLVFNLDQYGHRNVDRRTIVDIMTAYPSVEIFYTFAIESLIAFLQKSKPDQLKRQLQHLDIDPARLGDLTGTMSKQSWLGAAERIVFDEFRTCARYVSPFSIHNPQGWQYWLIHFANAYRARQVYNNILHANSSMQAHFGRSGLDMLSYDPRHEEGSLYLFDLPGREKAVHQLLDDIPRMVSDAGDAIEVRQFYEGIYNLTPAHSDDVHKAIIDNPDLEVLTPGGGQRRRAGTIAVGDVLKLKQQRSFPRFLGATVPK
jgi:three-Cys-motif partner protein